MALALCGQCSFEWPLSCVEVVKGRQVTPGESAKARRRLDAQSGCAGIDPFRGPWDIWAESDGACYRARTQGNMGPPV